MLSLRIQRLGDATVFRCVGRITKVGQSPEERQKACAVWKRRINQREDRIAQLTQQLDDLKQSAPLSVVVLHLWPDDQLHLQAVVEKQKALDQARADLSDLQEQARKAGAGAKLWSGAPRSSRPCFSSSLGGNRKNFNR
jgi:hypothetical protein